jgi:hypothetical protein
MLKPSRTLRTLILPYADRQRPDRLYMARYVYSIIDRPAWVVGDYLVEPGGHAPTPPVLRSMRDKDALPEEARQDDKGLCPSDGATPVSAAGRPGLTVRRLRAAVERDAYSDFLPMVAWVEDEEAFLCIDDGWGQAWELVPSAYMFAHVSQALQGLLNVYFPEGTVLQLITFADPLIDPALDAYLDLKFRTDPLVQASARRMADYLRAGTNGLDALHGIPVRDFRLFLAIKTRVKLGADLRRQVEEQLAKMGIRRLAPEELVSFYRRIFNDVFAPLRACFWESIGGMPAPPIARQIIEAGPDLCFEGPKSFSAIRWRAASPPGARAADHGRARQPSDGRDARERRGQRSDRRPLPLLPHRPVRSFPVRNSQARANPLRAKGRRQLCGRSRQADRGNRLDPRRGLKQPLRFGDPDHVGVWTRQRQAREMAARAKRLWESEPLPFMVQEESYLLPVLLAASLPFGLYPEKRTLKLLERDFRMPVKAAALMAPVQTDFRGGGRPALLYVGRKGQLSRSTSSIRASTITISSFQPNPARARASCSTTFASNIMPKAPLYASSISAAATASSARFARAAISTLARKDWSSIPSTWDWRLMARTSSPRLPWPSPSLPKWPMPRPASRSPPRNGICSNPPCNGRSMAGAARMASTRCGHG